VAVSRADGSADGMQFAGALGGMNHLRSPGLDQQPVFLLRLTVLASAISIALLRSRMRTLPPVDLLA
jgi:hypothetical protein